MKKITSIIFLSLLIHGLVPIGLDSTVAARTGRHMVIYGGLKAVDLYPVANSADILIVENARLDYLEHMKQINPQLKIFKYYNALGVYKIYPEWEAVNQKEAWFVHDIATGNRLKTNRYGWYLMDNGNEARQRFLVRKVSEQTEDIYDGVFLDDYWNQFVNKFVADGTDSAGWPPEYIINSWTVNMIRLLKRIRASYPKSIFINGAHNEYMPYVDGCMDEAFAHTNWQSDLRFPNAAEYMRSILRIQRLSKHGKTILVQSGSRGDYPTAIEKVYKFCTASYFLIKNVNTSFGFHPLHTYYFKGFPHYDDYKLNLGHPEENYHFLREEKLQPNLVANPGFHAGLKRWSILSGNPSLDSDTPNKGNSILFIGSLNRSDKIRSEFIPVKGNTDYTISADCKSEMNRAISASYKKLGLEGRFYDKFKKKLPGAYSLKFDGGTYDWLPFERTFTSPPNAAFYRIRLGFIGNGKGKGWVDNVYFGLASSNAKILKRHFSRGTIFVNFGRKGASLDLTNLETDYGIHHLHLDPHDGVILRPKGTK
jgi:hypothetical protein